MADQFKEHLFEYNYEGSTWGFSVMATSESDAKARLIAMSWGRYEGEVVARVPYIVPGTGRLLNFVLGARNFFRSQP